jgi:hypothetical protein
VGRERDSEVAAVTKYAICFDFPNDPDPYFAQDNGVLWTADLSRALRFRSEKRADKYLKKNYTKEIRKWGTVVEIGR